MLIFAGLLLGLAEISTAFDHNGGQFEFNDDQRFVEGKMNYELLLRDSQMPHYGTCWQTALSELQHGCKHLNDDVQSRLALAFTNCFLAKAGLQTFPCDKDTEISQCLASVSSNGFTAYTNFFTHTQSMCHFLQAQVWQKETDNTIGRLSLSSQKVVHTLEDTNQLQDSILAAQRKSLEQQELLLQSSSILSLALDGSKEDVRGMLEEFRSSTSEQRNLIFEVFDRLANLQNFVLGEVSGFYSLIFYPTALLLSYLLTSTSRTAAARFWLFVSFGCSLAIERGVVYFTVMEDLSYRPADEASQVMYNTIWWIRKLAMTACVVQLAWTAYKFQDYNLINNALLVQIQHQNLELKNYMEKLGIGSFSSRKSISVDVTDFSLPVPTKIDESDTSDSEFSYNSQDSDQTYVPSRVDESRLSMASEDDVYETASSRRSSVSAPFSLTLADVPEHQLVPAAVVTRPAVVKRRSGSNVREKVEKATTPHQSPYNLRSRSAVSPAYTSNSRINMESPETFGRLVKQMEKIARKNASQIIQSVRGNEA